MLNLLHESGKLLARDASVHASTGIQEIIAQQIKDLTQELHLAKPLAQQSQSVAAKRAKLVAATEKLTASVFYIHLRALETP